MRRPMVFLVAAAVAVSGMMTGVGPVSAAVPAPATNAVGQAAERSGPTAEQVQYRGQRRHYRGGRHWGGQRHYRGGRQWRGHRHYRSHRRSSGGAAAAAAGIIGLATGAIIAGSMANNQARARDWHAYCASRYRSYDPRSGTFLGYDGRRHPCR